MALQIAQREREGIRILELTGRLIVGPSTNQFRETVESCLKSGQSNIVLNLQAVEYIDSTGLGALVLAFTKCQKAGGMLKLVALNKRDMELLVLTKLTTIFDVYNEDQDAINSYFPNREIKRFDILSFVKQSRDDDE